MVSKTADEFSIMSPDQIRQFLLDEQVAVFGVGHRVDRHGKPIEQGLGAPGNETEQHWAALARAEGQAVCDEMRRKAEARRAGR